MVSECEFAKFDVSQHLDTEDPVTSIPYTSQYAKWVRGGGILYFEQPPSSPGQVPSTSAAAYVLEYILNDRNEQPELCELRDSDPLILYYSCKPPIMVEKKVGKRSQPSPKQKLVVDKESLTGTNTVVSNLILQVLDHLLDFSEGQVDRFINMLVKQLHGVVDFRELPKLLRNNLDEKEDRTLLQYFEGLTQGRRFILAIDNVDGVEDGHALLTALSHIRQKEYPHIVLGGRPPALVVENMDVLTVTSDTEYQGESLYTQAI